MFFSPSCFYERHRKKWGQSQQLITNDMYPENTAIFMPKYGTYPIVIIARLR